MATIINAPKLSDEWKLIPYKETSERLYSPFYRQGVQAGFPSPAEDFKEERLSLDERFVKDPLTTFFVEVLGVSMFPTLQIGDTLIVHTDLTIGHNQIGIFSLNYTDYTVKRYDRNKNALIADNPQYPMIELKEEDVLIVLGVVTTFFRPI